MEMSLMRIDVEHPHSEVEDNYNCVSITYYVLK
jgi:hypothetical protein